MIDELARTASKNLRSATTSDLEAGMREVYAGHRRRRLENVRVAAAAVALALGVGWWGGHAMTGGKPATPQPVGPSGVVDPKTCSGRVHCLGPLTYRFDLTQPVTWHLPPGYELSSGTGATDWQVESRAQRLENGGGPYQYDTLAGVTVLEGVRAASADGESVRTDVADAPRAFVTWLAAQPYLNASTPRPARVDGHPAWHVRVSLAESAGQGSAVCNDKIACYATTVTPDHQVTGIRGDMVADYTAFRVPGGGTTVVWSWAFSHDRDALSRNRIAAQGLSWPIS
jgi:hypothetical protein